MARNLFWDKRKTSLTVRHWHRRAAAIPDRAIREDALRALTDKRENVEGASLFSILTKRRDEQLLQLLVTYQILWDFLDSASERGAHVGQANGRQLHRALVEAIDLNAPISDYYRYHPWKDDGGYMLALVQACRRGCAELPFYGEIRSFLIDGVERCAVQSVNHEPDPSKRNLDLKSWVRREFTDQVTLSWFELTAAASAFVPYPLLAAAAEGCSERDLTAIGSTYFPWVALLIAMLDSYVDLTVDEVEQNHSYIAHYPDIATAVRRLADVIAMTVSKMTKLPNGRRHRIIATSMVAMYLSKKGANTPELRAYTRTLVRAGGPQTILLLSAAGAWRLTLGGRSTGRPAQARLPPGLRAPHGAQTVIFWRAPLAYYRLCRRCYGKRFTLRAVNHPPMVFFSDPQAVRALLAAPAEVLHPGEGGATIAPIVGARSFMLLDEEEHLNGRRAVLPALQRRVVEHEASWVESAVRRSASEWPRDAPIRLHPRLRALTLEVVLRRIFTGREFGSAVRLPALQERTLAMLDVTAGPLLALPALRRGLGAGAWRGFLRDRAAADELLHVLIDKRARAIEAGRGLERTDVLTRLLAVGDGECAPMTREQLRDNAMSLILAGHETTASQLAWAFQLLAHNPRVQGRLIEEIDGGGGEEYLMATVQEVLRHRPVFLFTIPRAVKRPIEIEGFTYEPPAHLLGCIYLLHHDPEVYAEPYEFRPERFLAGQPAPYTWLPWGGGRRRCPGSHLALLEMKTVLRIVLETMTVHPASRRMERPRWRSVIVTPHAGSRVVLRARTGRAAVPTDARTSAVQSCPARVR